jgi:hypothetical protein
VIEPALRRSLMRSPPVRRGGFFPGGWAVCPSLPPGPPSPGKKVKCRALGPGPMSKTCQAPATAVAQLSKEESGERWFCKSSVPAPLASDEAGGDQSPDRPVLWAECRLRRISEACTANSGAGGWCSRLAAPQK